MIGAGATRRYIIAATRIRPDKGEELIGSRPLREVRVTEDSYDRRVGRLRMGAWRAIRFEFSDREQAVLQPFGREVHALLETHRGAQSTSGAAESDGRSVGCAGAGRPDDTSQGPFTEDVLSVLTYDDGTDTVVGLSAGEQLLPRLQELPGFDNETFIQAMAVSDEGISVLWRR